MMCAVLGSPGNRFGSGWHLSISFIFSNVAFTSEHRQTSIPDLALIQHEELKQIAQRHDAIQPIAEKQRAYRKCPCARRYIGAYVYLLSAFALPHHHVRIFENALLRHSHVCVRAQ